MRPDFKKLAMVFLASALVAGLGVYVFSSYWTSPASEAVIKISTRNPNADKRLNVFAGEKSLSPAAGGGVLVPPLPPIDPNNFTQQLARGLAQKVVEANPAGPISGEGGELVLKSPSPGDANSVLKEGVDAADFRGKVTDADVKSESNFSKEDIGKYFKRVDGSFGETIGGGDFKQIAASDLSVDSINAGTIVLATAYQDAKNITVPIPLKNLHKSTLQFLLDSKNSLEAIRNFDIDPAKALVVSQSAKQVINRDIAAVRREMDVFKKSELYSSLNEDEKNRAIAFYQKYFGVPKVGAQGLSVPVDFTPASFGFLDSVRKWVQTVYEWGQGIALQVMKNGLITMFAQQVTGWVSGGGNPQFIQNWGVFLSKASNQGALQSLHSLARSTGRGAGGICDRFGPQMVRGLSTQFNTYVDTGNCNMGAFGNQLKAFNQDFSNGGWEAFARAATPEGNYFTSYMGASIKIQEDAAKAKAAAQAKALASKGFEGKKTCVPWDAEMYEVGDKFELDSMTQDCPEGTVEQIETPGASIADLLTNALGSNTQLITGANNVVGIAVAMAQSVATKLMNSDSDGLRGVEKANIANSRDTCDFLIELYGENSLQYRNCMSSAVSVDDQGALAATKGNLRNILDQLTRNQQTNADNFNNLKGRIPYLKDRLEDTKSVCGQFPADSAEYGRYNEAVSSTINLNIEQEFLSGATVKSSEEIQREGARLLESGTESEMQTFLDTHNPSGYNTEALESFFANFEKTAIKNLGQWPNAGAKCASVLDVNGLSAALRNFNNGIPGSSSIKFVQ